MVCAPAGAEAATYPAGFEERTVAANLSAPTGMAWAPDGRLFVIEKEGRLKVVPPGAGTTATTILDIANEVNSYWDRGLLGIAVDSDFTNQPYVYLLYTRELQPMIGDGEGAMSSRLDRVTIGPGNQVSGRTTLLGTHPSACPAPANTVDCIPSEGASHSIGSVRSAPDGTLWVGSGDASSFNIVDPLAYRTYNTQSMAGKIMHVDRNGRGLPGHPFCPTNADLTHVCTKIWAGGFRNPFRFKLRPGGGLTLGDVGWGTTEEVDFVPTAPPGGGRMYGWPCYEGSGRTGGYRDREADCNHEYAKEGTPQAHLAPVHQYAHNSAGGAVMGGPTYSGPYPQSYQGDIFFGDYAQGFVRKLNLNAQGDVTSVDNFAAGGWSGVDLELTPAGELAYAAYGDGSPGTGAIRRVVYAPGNASPVARITTNPSPPNGAAPLTLNFSGSGSTDQDNDPLSYEWRFGDGTAVSTAAAPSHTYVNPGAYTATLTVRDGRGGSNTASVQISAGNTAPAPQVAAPARYRAGQSFQLQGSATDAQDGPIPGSRIAWDVKVIHADHVHSLGTYGGTSLTLNAIADHDADARYRIVMTATDSGGLSAQETVELLPETTTVRLRSSPSGASLSYGGRVFTAPQDLVTAIGYHTTVSASDPFELGGAIFDFTSWSNGGARVQDYVVPPAGAQLTANYTERVGPPPDPPPTDPSPAQPSPAGPPAGGTPPAPGTSQPPATAPADSRGPSLRLLGVNTARGHIRGTVTDPSRIAVVEVALRRTLRGGDCSWWLERKRMMSGPPRPCDRPRWIDARLAATSGDVQWLLALGKRLPPGTYRVLVRAEDTKGNKSALPLGRDSLVKVRPSRR